jgi:hypothetical protein
MGPAAGTLRRDPFVVPAVCAILAVLVVAIPDPARASDPIVATPGHLEVSVPHLVIDPTSWWMMDGNETPFVATWVDPSPGCALSPSWFRWSIGAGGVEGILRPTDDANATFTAAAEISGTTTLIARSGADLECGSETSAIVATANANITVDSPISLQDLSIGPNPITPGEFAYVRGNVSGGMPPYSLRITWGDGTRSVVNLSAPGSFRASHPFPAGSYRPGLTVTDSAGLVVQSIVGATLDVSSSLAVGITADRIATDVGVPVRFKATVLQEPPGASTDWSCHPAAAFAGDGSAGSTNFTCWFLEPGIGVASFEILPRGGAQAVAASLPISVEPLPALSVIASNLTTEVGEPVFLGFNVTGGVAPFRLDWAAVGAGEDGSISVAADGTILVSFDPNRSGSLDVDARLVDADGSVASNVTILLGVDPALNVSFVAAREAVPEGAELALSGSVTAGVPPFLWLVADGSLPANATTPTGSLSAVGGFEWSGTYRTEGWTTLTAVVVDAAGAFTITSIDLEEVPPLDGNLSVDPGGPPVAGAFRLALSLSGGLPPFVVEINGSDGETWNRTASSDGDVTWTLPVQGSGVLALRVAVFDALGTELEWNRTADILAPPPAPVTGSPPPAPLPASTPLVVGTVLGVAGIAVGFSFYWRRRNRSTPATPPDPVSVLRRIIEPADGADRATVELLAEEAGISLDLVRSTIDHLIAAGSIRSEATADGEEVISWSPTPPP